MNRISTNTVRKKKKKEKKQRNRYKSSIVLPLTKRVKLIGIEKKVNEYTISMFEIEEDEIDRVFFR